MRTSILAVLSSVPLLLSFTVSAQTKPAPKPVSEQSKTADSSSQDSARLPVKRVVLYKNGVGYFEHAARVHGTQDLSIDFTTAQLNDVLKSLTAVDLGEGRVSSVRYNSIAPLDERLKSLRLPFGEQITQAEYLSALRGARVEAHSGAVSATGRLLSVEKIRREKGKDQFEAVTAFSIITDSGEMKNFELGSGTSVRIAERELTDEVSRYLSLIGSSRSRDVRRMSFTASGSGDRDIFVSYISEVPIWKSTYRIIFPDKPGEKPLLQGWAIVDNTIGEDWKDVQLSLVAGAPQSFIQNISQPISTRRPVMPLPQSAMLTPQSHEATMQADQEEENTEAVNGTGVGGGIGAGSGGGVGGGAFRANTLNGQVAASSAQQVQTEAAELVSTLKKQSAEAEGASLGDFFEYSIKQRITIGKNQSALVPILQSHVEAERVTLWNPNSVPLRALWIKNTSGQVLDSGSFNVLEANTFAGEGVMEAIHPDERRLLSYAGDAAVHVKSEDESRDEPYSRVRIYKGVMELTQELHRSTKFAVRNADNEPRLVVLEFPAQQGWELSPSTPKPEESTESYHRFRVPVDGGKTADLTVETIHAQETSYSLTNLDSNLVALLVQEKRVTPAMQQAIDNIMLQKGKIAVLNKEIAQRNSESGRISGDQSRIRENMKALKGSSEEKALLQRYVSQLDSQETRLDAVRKETDDLTAQENQASAELERMIMEVNVDEKF